MAPKYQIHYFPFQGLAEASRLILEHAGEPYENIIVQVWPRPFYWYCTEAYANMIQDWPKEKLVGEVLCLDIGLH